MVRTETFRGLCHGTTADSAERIKKEGFILSKEHNSWCGAGIYFYDIKAKAWWSAGRTCEEIAKETGMKVKPAVVFADIVDIPRSDIFDLRAPADMEEFRKCVSPMLDEEKLLLDEITDEQERIITLRSMLISFYAKMNNKKLIIGTFEQREQPLHREAIEFATGLRLVLGAETIYCARDNSILTNIR